MPHTGLLKPGTCLFSFLYKIYFISAAAAVIHGKSAVFVKPGSTISLTCSIRLFSSPPTSIQWFRDTRALNLDSARGGVSLENEKTPQGTRSTLIVTKATGDDTGNYTCSPSSGHAASVMVHVVDGKIWIEFRTSFEEWIFQVRIHGRVRGAYLPVAVIIYLPSHQKFHYSWPCCFWGVWYCIKIRGIFKVNYKKGKRKYDQLVILF